MQCQRGSSAPPSSTHTHTHPGQPAALPSCHSFTPGGAATWALPSRRPRLLPPPSLLPPSQVWVTLMLLNKSVTRWSTASPLSEPTLAAWKGFVTMIVDGYFDKRMAWYPIDRLQLELLGTHGLAPAPDQVRRGQGAARLLWVHTPQGRGTALGYRNRHRCSPAPC